MASVLAMFPLNCTMDAKNCYQEVASRGLRQMFLYELLHLSLVAKAVLALCSGSYFNI